MNAELQQKVVTTRAELQNVKARAAALQRSKQIATMTQTQVHAEKPAAVWQGIGKAFMRASPAEYDEGVAARLVKIDEQISDLEKKQTYYATTLEKLVLALQNA